MSIIELINMYRYNETCYYFKTHAKKIHNIFFMLDPSDLNNYISFVKKTIFVDSFNDIYCSYYPHSLMTYDRVKNAMNRYIFGQDKNNSDSHNDSINIFINEICDVYSQIYIFSENDKEKNMGDDMIIWNNILDNYVYSSSYSIISDYLRYINFYKHAYSKYTYDDITNNMRVWHRNTKDVKRMMFITKKTSFCDIINLNIDIFVEIKGFSDYSNLFDMLTCNTFNEYCTINMIIESCSKIFTKYDLRYISMDFYFDDLVTIIVPQFICHYHKYISKLYLNNPLCYPYSYHNVYKYIHNTCEMKNANLMMLINNNGLFNMYNDKFMMNKNINILYSKSTYITYDETFKKHMNLDMLLTILKLYSDVNIMMQ
jgi:hypothetical protein